MSRPRFLTVGWPKIDPQQIDRTKRSIPIAKKIEDDWRIEEGNQKLGRAEFCGDLERPDGNQPLLRCRTDEAKAGAFGLAWRNRTGQKLELSLT